MQWWRMMYARIDWSAFSYGCRRKRAKGAKLLDQIYCFDRVGLDYLLQSGQLLAGDNRH